jgi:hypothetical protein
VNGRPWSKDEIEEVAVQRADGEAAVPIAVCLGRTPQALYNKLTRLGWQRLKKAKKWERYLYLGMAGYTHKEAAALLGVAVSAVRTRWRVLRRKGYNIPKRERERKTVGVSVALVEQRDPIIDLVKSLRRD